MLSLSYYDKIDTILKNSNNKNKEDKVIPNKLSSVFKLTNNLDNQLINNNSQGEYSIAYLYKKLKEDMPKLERFLKDDKYRKGLENSLQPRYNPELFDILGLEKIVKEKLGIP